jgi:hypothetical protein
MELHERDMLNQYLGKIDAEVEAAYSLPRNHRLALLLDDLSSLRNDVTMMLKRGEDGMSLEDAAKPCKFFEKIVIGN